MIWAIVILTVVAVGAIVAAIRMGRRMSKLESEIKEKRRGNLARDKALMAVGKLLENTGILEQERKEILGARDIDELDRVSSKILRRDVEDPPSE